jgi:hypothetical protein
MIDEKIHGRLTPEKMVRIIKQYRAGGRERNQNARV